MVQRVLALSGALFVIGLVVPWQAAQAAPPVEAFGNLPAIDDAQVSPDGKRVALLQSAQGSLVATIYTMGAPPGTRPVVFKAPEDGKVRNIVWANDDRLLIWISMTHKPRGQNRPFEFWRIASLKADGSESGMLFRSRDFNYIINSPFLRSILPNDPEHILMIQIDTDRYSFGGKAVGERIEQKAFTGLSVYKVNVNNGREKKVEKAERHTDDWIVDSGGNVRIRVDDENDRTVIHARGPQGGAFREIASYRQNDWRSAMAFWGFGNDPNKVYVTASPDNDRRGVFTFDLTAGKIADRVFLHDRFDVGGALLRDWHTDRVVGARFTDHMPQTVYWDDAYAAVHKKMEGLFKGKTVHILSLSRDRNAATLLVEGPGDPGTYYFYSATLRQVAPLGDRYPALKGVDLGTVKPITYQARDGLTIPAYLTLPPGKEAKSLPLVVLPHGGPAARDDQSFDWWAGFYASRGYAVLQPNFRGSAGYGRKFIEAGFGEFGGKMQDDLTDGVKHLVAQGIADPRRVCIIGASYGGYAALAGAAFTPEHYACAVSVNGVSDLVNMMGSQVRLPGPSTDNFSVQYWQLWLGNRYTDRDKMIAASPAKNTADISAPILLIHGKDDTVVSFGQSKIMADALSKAGKPHQLIALDGEDHWLSYEESRLRVLKETEAFLKAHIGG